ncbi:hypothetical protein ACH4TQ_50200 [Streptomyces sp. NPDC021218]|uniref:hypothetical protein n=1 Tax=Streptomyces sp. NPDC021218 TaxID=3365119 RepID=UPI00378D9E37
MNNNGIPAVEPVGDELVDDVVERRTDRADASGTARLGESGLLTEITRAVLERALDAELPGLTGFALHLLRDLDAVTAGLTLEWSSGSVEGAVNRIKKIKR